MLADGARVAGDGKLYIFGGQWDRLFTASVPATHPIVAIALVIELDYHEAMQNHPVEITLRDGDGANLGPRALMNMRVGHPPLLEPGGSVSVPIAMELPQVVFPRYDRYEWVIEIDGDIQGRLPITVSPLAGAPQLGLQPPQSA